MPTLPEESSNPWAHFQKYLQPSMRFDIQRYPLIGCQCSHASEVPWEPLAALHIPGEVLPFIETMPEITQWPAKEAQNWPAARALAPLSLDASAQTVYGELGGGWAR